MHLLKQIKVTLLQFTNRNDPYSKLSPRPYIADSSPLLFQDIAITDHTHPNTKKMPGDTRSNSNPRVTPGWVSIMISLLDDRSEAASKLENEASSGSPITSIQLHRDLVSWSMTVASAERELKVILVSLKEDGVSLDEVLKELTREEDMEIVGRLWRD